ncbi:hypothetical protein GGF42_001952 [Coemansia sp. RSA 2424]|nr:hypothetical protein GGF42_001952 [Coemansia sp. RSA 2424]
MPLVAKRARPLIADGDPDPRFALEHVRPLLVDAGTSMDEMNVRDGPQADIALAIFIAAMLLATQARCYAGTPALPLGRNASAAMLSPASAILKHARPALVDAGVSPAPQQTAASYTSTGLDAPRFAEIAVGPGVPQTADAGSRTWSPQQVASLPGGAAVKRRSISISLLTGRAAQLGAKSHTRLLRRRATVVDTIGGRAQVAAATANTDDPAMGFTLSLKHADRLSWIDSPPSDRSTLSPAASSPLQLAASPPLLLVASTPVHSPVSSLSFKGKEVEVAADAANFFPEETALELARAKAPLSAVYTSTEQCAVAAATRFMLAMTAPDRAATLELLKPTISFLRGSSPRSAVCTGAEQCAVAAATRFVLVKTVPNIVVALESLEPVRSVTQDSSALVCRSLESTCTEAFCPDQPSASAFFFGEQVSVSSHPLAIIADSRFVEETEYDSDSTSVVDYRQLPSVDDALALGGGGGGSTGKFKDKLRAPLLRVKASISSLAGSKRASLGEPVDRVSTTSLSSVKTVVRKMSRLVRPTLSGSAASKPSKHIVAEPSSSPSPSSSTWRRRKSKAPRSHSEDK